jgi:hypothetical protein
MKLLKGWSCEFMIAPDSPLTVGQKFAILCKGAAPLNTKSNVEIVNVKEDDMYNLVLVRSKFKSENELFLSVASWKTGKHNLKVVPIKIGEDVIVTKGPVLNIKSTLAKDTQMNMPPGPIIHNPPEYIWYFLGFTVFMILALLLKAYRNSRKRDRGMLKLNSLKTSLKPFFEFQKQVRSAKKTLEKKMTEIELKELSLSFYKNVVTYMSLEVKSPLFVLTEKQIRKVFKKKSIDSKLIKDYFYITNELKRSSIELNAQSNILTYQSDLENLVDESMMWSQKTNKYFQNLNEGAKR